MYWAAVQLGRLLNWLFGPPKDSSSDTYIGGMSNEELDDRMREEGRP